jgi:hypothetical protein
VDLLAVAPGIIASTVDFQAGANKLDRRTAGPHPAGTRRPFNISTQINGI